MNWLTSFFITSMALVIGQDPETTRGILTADHLLRQQVRSESGGIAGEIEELVLDPEGSVRLVVVELLAPERKTIAIPWRYLDVREDGSVWLSASESDILRAPTFPDAVATSSTSSRRLERAPAPVPAAQATYIPSGTPAIRFQRENVRTYRGVVVGTMTAPLEGTTDEVVAIIDVGSGEVEAHLGPRSYLESIGLDIEPGKSVVFEGSPSEVEGSTVVVVSKISLGDRTYLLREASGAPRWP